MQETTTTALAAAGGWQALCQRLEDLACPATPADAAAVVRRAAATAAQPPLATRHLYLQQASSFLVGERCRDVPLDMATRAVVASRASGLVMRFWVPMGLPGAGDMGLDHGVAWLNLNLCHPRYAALWQAEQKGGALQDRSAYADFDNELCRLCDGRLGLDGAQALADALLARALKLTGCSHVAVDPRVHAMMQLCDQREDWCIHELAAALGLSASRLSHLMSRETGLSFRQYTVWLRTMNAWAQVALKPQRPLTEIAHDAGFFDLAHMTNSFRGVLGCTPSQMREPGRWRIHGRPTQLGQRVPPRWAPAAAVQRTC